MAGVAILIASDIACNDVQLQQFMTVCSSKSDICLTLNGSTDLEQVVNVSRI